MALAGAAAAQSSVTLYGRVNTTVESQKSGSAGRVMVVQNNSSRWGMRGVEDLGGGMSALFKLESGFSSDTGASATSFFGRESSVGLRGPMGMLRMGQITNIVYTASADYISLHNHDTGPSADALFPFAVSAANKENTLIYTSPVFGGFQGEFSYGLGEGVNPSARNAVLSYEAGALQLAGGYSSRGGNHLAVVRAMYTVGDFILAGYVERDEIAAASRNNLRLAAQYNLGPSEFHLNYGRAGDRGGIAGTGATQFTAGYNYNLSKRSKLYGYYTRLHNEPLARYAAFGSLGPGQSQNSVAIGIRHNF
jgi:predicted porin